jgi:cobalt-zinc-cadmium efflux system membrane fusion protein
MKKSFVWILSAAFPLLLGCGSGVSDPKAEAPPPAQVERQQDGGAIRVDHPEQIEMFTATARDSRPEMFLTGVVAPDVARNVPVVSLASGRVQAIHARLGDTVQKGQLLLTIRSSDISGAFSDYRKAVADEALARGQMDRAKDLHDHGAISLNDFQIAQNVEDKAKVDL